jgi:hypothetical protein
MIFNADKIRTNIPLEMCDNGISEKIAEESGIGDGDAGIDSDGDGEIRDKLGKQISIKMKSNTVNIKSPLLPKRNIIQRPGLELQPLKTVQIQPRLTSIDEILSEPGMSVKKLGKIMDKAAKAVGLGISPETMKEFSETVLMGLGDYYTEDHTPPQPKGLSGHPKMKFLGLKPVDLPNVPDYKLMDHINYYFKGQKDSTYFDAFMFDE